VMDEAGKVLARKRLPEGAAGIAQLHQLVGAHLGEEPDEAQVAVGIETDRGPWVAALVAAEYLVFPVNPLQASPVPGPARGIGARAPSGQTTAALLTSTSSGPHSSRSGQVPPRADPGR
jgi:hypothetical protein